MRSSSHPAAPAPRPTRSHAGLGFAFRSIGGLAGLLAAISFAAAGCASTERAAGERSTPAASAPPATIAADSTAGSTAIVWVNGMGCPLCATNVDQQLRRVPGVTSVAINLGTGMVTVGIDPAKSPSEAALSRAVQDSGFTLVGIQMPGQAPTPKGGDA